MVEFFICFRNIVWDQSLLQLFGLEQINRFGHGRTDSRGHAQIPSWLVHNLLRLWVLARGRCPECTHFENDTHKERHTRHAMCQTNSVLRLHHSKLSQKQTVIKWENAVRCTKQTCCASPKTKITAKNHVVFWERMRQPVSRTTYLTTCFVNTSRQIIIEKRKQKWRSYQPSDQTNISSTTKIWRMPETNSPALSDADKQQIEWWMASRESDQL